jgi:lysophospholipid acyltransferase 1/2
MFPCSQRPALVEYLSYNLNFLSVLVGPCSNYQDYVDFIEGRHIHRRLRQQAEGAGNGHLNGSDQSPDLSPLVRTTALWRPVNSHFELKS